jgi:ATP-dependent DNA helicase RecQ
MRDVEIFNILKGTFGYTEFRHDQKKIINSILDGNDTLAIMPTGGGKSLCYQIPALYLDGITLVISPLISLMHDQVLNLKQSGVNAVFLNSSQSFSELRKSKTLISEGKVKLIYVSPEGILSPHLCEFFKDITVSLIAIDEAHCISQWGNEFRNDYTRLGELKDLYPQVPVVALTATADAKTREDIAHQLRLEEPKSFISSFDRPNIKYLIMDRKDELKQLDAFISTHHPADTGIVYCLSRDKVDRVAKALKKLGYPAVPYHAGLTQSERKEHQTLFNVEERIIVVATIAFGMGIDRPDVRFVAHLDLPKSIESYYQETGRAGRDGKPATAWMIYGLQDVVKLSHMLETTEASEQYKMVARHKLDSMLALCETASCRRQYLLEYFGETRPDYCGNCDTCIAPPVLWDATIESQKIMSVIYRTGQSYGAGHLIDVIMGKTTTKVATRGHDVLSVFGIGKDQSKEYWNVLLRQLLNLNYLCIRSWEYRSLALTQKSLQILREGKKLSLRKQEASITKTKKVKKGKKSHEEKNEQADTDLYQALRSLRIKLAREARLPPYMIFSDRSLQDMCRLLPKTPEDFLEVHGVGQSKLDKFGPAFLEAILENLSPATIPTGIYGSSHT